MERRKHSRLGVGINSVVRYRVAGGGKARKETKVQDIALGGLRFMAGERLEIGTPLDLAPPMTEQILTEQTQHNPVADLNIIVPIFQSNLGTQVTFAVGRQLKLDCLAVKSGLADFSPPLMPARRLFGGGGD